MERHGATVVKALAAAGLACVVCAAAFATQARPGTRADCDRTSTGLTALPDLGKRSYQGFGGGLYPGGSNAPSTRYLKQGAGYVARVKQRSRDGVPAADGKIVLLSVGMSNTTQEFSAFKQIADADARKNPGVVVVDGAQGGQDAVKIRDGRARFWSRVDERLTAAGVTAEQVQVVWLKEAIARESRAFPADARGLQADLRAIVEVLRRRYRNLSLVYLSSRTYAGYATTPLNPEPYAYQSSFAVKWLIQDRIEGRLAGPWLAWGPYLWTDGLKGRRDGFVWTCDNVRADGTHPAESGRRKVAELLLRFFKSDRTTASWFTR
jgi:hypothetical protein